MMITFVEPQPDCPDDAEWLKAAEPIHRQLRPAIPTDYRKRLAEIAGNGGRLILAVEGKQVLGVALWRLVENTYEGRRLYVDDLITDEAARSQGVGHLLLEFLAQRAQALSCNVLALDSGVQRQRAHHFYFREGMHIASFSFKKDLE